MAIPANQIPIGEGLNPAGKPGASFFVDRVELEQIERDGPEWKFEDARFIHECIQAPDAIFEGLGRPGHRESLCYSVRPTLDPQDPASPGLPRYGCVFLAFVATAVGGYLVFDWEWRDEDSDCPGHPANWETDFARRTWHKT